MAESGSSGPGRRLRNSRAAASVRNRREKRHAKRKLYCFDDLVYDPYSLMKDDRLSFDFDVDYSSPPYKLVESEWGDCYAIALYARLAWTPLPQSSQVDERWDDRAIDDFYKVDMPKWLSDEAFVCGGKKYYVVKESELQENDWLHLFTEIAFYAKTERMLEASSPLEIKNVVIETKEEDTTEALKAENAIFYVSYKCNDDPSTGCAGDHKAIIRKTMDGKPPEHLYLEVVHV